METMNETVEQSQYLTFHLAEEEYAIGILRVKEIIQYDTLTRLPSVPAFIRGVINLRGNVVAVVDLATKFGIQEAPVTKRTCIVIVEVEQDGESTEMGLIADAVSQVIGLADDEIKPPPSFGSRIHADYLEGMGMLEDKFALILDIDRVLSAEEFQEVTSSVEEAVEAEKEEKEEKVEEEETVEEANGSEPKKGKSARAKDATSG